MSTRYYVNQPLSPGPVELVGAEAHHLATVSRIPTGSQVCLFNGDGHEYPATVEESSRRRVVLRILRVETPVRELGFRLEVAAPLPKQDRLRFMIEKLTELGVTRYTPVRTHWSQSHSDRERAGKLQQYVVEASKQCGRNVLMSIEPAKDWEVHCRSADLPENKVLAHLTGTSEFLETLPSAPSRSDWAVAVGPEAGFTEEEVEVAREAGWKVVSLGPRVMRVETAALALATLVALSDPVIRAIRGAQLRLTR
jgi:16S rRNA (uracil1498-N3)-methyltransferase